MENEQKEDIIRSHIYPNCSVCGNIGESLYAGLKDCLFDAPGKWNFKRCRNPKCGLVWLDPMPTKEDIGKAYRNYYTHQEVESIRFKNLYNSIKEGYLAFRYGYNKKSIEFWKRLLGMSVYIRPGLRAHIDFSVMFLPAIHDGILLEVGCGSGEMLKLMKELGWQVKGVDFDPSAVENARRKGLQVYLGTLEAQQFPDNHFDAITMSHVIEHIHDPLQLILECYRILKPGGHLVISTPNIGSWGHKLFKSYWRGLEPPRHLQIFTLPSLCCLAKIAGFKKIKKWSTMHWSGPIFEASWTLKQSKKNISRRLQQRIIHQLSKVMQLTEWALLKIIPYIGTEVTMKVEK